jgi:D-psicose/D-tagatose/L-ribulose 3-epimerase
MVAREEIRVKLSCTQMMLGERSLEEKFAIARESGFDGIDLRGDLIVDRVDEIRALIQQTGLPVPTVYGRITIPLLSRTVAERAQSLELVRTRLRDASALGATSLIVVPIFGEARIAVDRGQGVEEVERAMLLALLSELIPDAEAAGVRIVLEPLNRGETHLLTSPACAAELTRGLDSPWVGTMADTYHMDREGQDAVQEIALSQDQLMLIHLSDRNRTLPGEGGIDFAPMLRSLDAIGYDGFMGYECNGPFDPDQLRRSVEWVRAGGRA